LEVGVDGLTSYKQQRFHPSTKLCKRVYPHIHNMDGFFVAKFRKFANGVKSIEAATEAEEERTIKAAQKSKKQKENAKKKAKRMKKKVLGKRDADDKEVAVVKEEGQSGKKREEKGDRKKNEGDAKQKKKSNDAPKAEEKKVTK
jgi:ribosomal RNA methyltransferase Nop2